MATFFPNLPEAHAPSSSWVVTRYSIPSSMAWSSSGVISDSIGLFLSAGGRGCWGRVIGGDDGRAGEGEEPDEDCGGAFHR